MRYVIVSLVILCGFSFVGCGGDDGPSGTDIEEICGDSIDNDEDGQIDCNDTECANLFECKNPPLDAGPAVDAGPAPTDTGSTSSTDAGSVSPTDAGSTAVADGGSSSQTDEICDDGIDNDGDLMTDCADEDCFGVGDCARGPEDCADGMDNNDDGLTDCNDPLCAGDQNCGGGQLSLPCGDLVMCLNSCIDDACREGCREQGTEQSLALAQALIACDSDNECQNNPDCLVEHCADQEEACQRDMMP